MSDVYYKFYKENCFSLNFKNWTKVRDQIFKYIKDEKCPPELKILFGEWLFKKIYMYYKPSDSIRKENCDHIKDGVEKCNILVTKSEYLQFHDYIAMSHIAEYFYSNRFSDRDKYFILQLLNDTQLVKNILNDSRFERAELIHHFTNWIDKADLFEQKSNLLHLFPT